MSGAGGVQLFRSWAHLDMASVLSGWYAGYHHHHNAAAAQAAGYHNLFNSIANFIEYEPYPKRRKVDHHHHHHHKNGGAAVAAAAYGYAVDFQDYHHHHHHHELTHKEARGAGSGAAGINSSGSLYRPYTTVQQQQDAAVAAKAAKSKTSKFQDSTSTYHHHGSISDTVGSADGLLLSADELHEASTPADEAERQDAGRITFDHLFPEILCLIFSKLDIQSLGRAAQVCIKIFV